MIVVSNTSPLINLASIDHLDLLRRIFSRILIPAAVWQEAVIDGEGQPGAKEICQAGWIERLTVTNRQLVHSLGQELDPGEAEAISLAVEIKADWLLMDERLGRQTARHFGLGNIGLIGILKVAKLRGEIASLRPLLEQLRDIAGFRISQALFEQALLDVGEF